MSGIKCRDCYLTRRYDKSFPSKLYCSKHAPSRASLPVGDDRSEKVSPPSPIRSEEIASSTIPTEDVPSHSDAGLVESLWETLDNCRSCHLTRYLEKSWPRKLHCSAHARLFETPKDPEAERARLSDKLDSFDNCRDCAMTRRFEKKFPSNLYCEDHRKILDAIRLIRAEKAVEKSVPSSVEPSGPKSEQPSSTQGLMAY